MNINRIAIIGISASGKSVLGREMASKTGLPLVHMDQLFWRGNWQEVPEKEYLEKHREIIAQDQWIIEGYIEESMADRLKCADQIIYLDYSGIVCAWRLICRWFRHRGHARPELPEEALETWQYETFWKVLMRKERIRIENTLALAGTEKVIRFKSPEELNKYLKQS